MLRIAANLDLRDYVILNCDTDNSQIISFLVKYGLRFIIENFSEEIRAGTPTMLAVVIKLGLIFCQINDLILGKGKFFNIV